MRNSRHWSVAAPSARRRKAQTAALSAFRSHQPDCTATGGNATAVSGQQQVPGLAGMGTHFSNWLPLALCLHVTHSQPPTHKHTHQQPQQPTLIPPCQLYHPCRRGNCHTVSAEWTFRSDDIHKHLANTYVQCKRKCV